MAQSITEQANFLFNIDGSLKNDETIIEYLKSTDNNQVYESLSLNQLKKLLERYEFMYVILTKEKFVRNKNNISWLNGLTLKEVMELRTIIHLDIKTMTERFRNLQDIEQKDQEAFQAIMGIIMQKKVPQQQSKPLPSLADAALKKKNHIDPEAANIGDTITIEYCDEPYETYVFTLVSENEEDRPGQFIISMSSSLGKATYGFKVKDKISWTEANNHNEAIITVIQKNQTLGGHVRTHNKN